MRTLPGTEQKQQLTEDFLRPLPTEDELGGELFSRLNNEALDAS